MDYFIVIYLDVIWVGEFCVILVNHGTYYVGYDLYYASLWYILKLEFIIRFFSINLALCVNQIMWILQFDFSFDLGESDIHNNAIGYII